MVKSRRRASSVSVPKTLSRRMSRSPSSSPSSSRGLARNVAVSMIFLPKKTWARRKRRPMMRQLRKVARMSFGVALVATSKSLGMQAEQQVADAAPDQVRGEAALGQAPHHPLGIPIDQRVIKRGHVSWWVARPRIGGQGRQSRPAADLAGAEGKKKPQRPGGQPAAEPANALACDCLY